MLVDCCFQGFWAANHSVMFGDGGDWGVIWIVSLLENITRSYQPGIKHFVCAKGRAAWGHTLSLRCRIGNAHYRHATSGFASADCSSLRDCHMWRHRHPSRPIGFTSANRRVVWGRVLFLRRRIRSAHYHCAAGVFASVYCISSIYHCLWRHRHPSRPTRFSRS